VTDRSHDDLTAQLLSYGAATLGEAGAAALDPRVAAVWRGAQLAAPAFTAACADGDNLAIHVATAEAPHGSVVVAQIDGPTVRGYWGEVLTTGAEARGLVGLVIDGSVRDVAALEAHGFPVFASGIALRGATKARPGEVGTSARVGGVEVRTGDWVVGDADGVVVIRADDLDGVLVAAAARTFTEAELFTALREGATTVELLHLDASPIRRA
jgi:4-hydroxy-4-methyl-2-oxoglutarate aldolase